MTLHSFNDKYFSALSPKVNNSKEMLKNTNGYLLFDEYSITNLALPFL
ncbi:MAG: hypothetical protein PWP52_2065 [Bacteroidales bacterium]|nr:hypothetical protein [Bacteroidales bacterium]